MRLLAVYRLFVARRRVYPLRSRAREGSARAGTRVSGGVRIDRARKTERDWPLRTSITVGVSPMFLTAFTTYPGATSSLSDALEMAAMPSVNERKNSRLPCSLGPFEQLSGGNPRMIA
jgi:hypothetical protein